MKIASSAVDLTASSSLSVQRSKSARLEYWTGNRGVGALRQFGAEAMDTASISKLARKLALEAEPAKPNLQTAAAGTAEACEEIKVELSEEDLRRIELLEKLMHKLTGKHFKFYIPSGVRVRDRSLPVVLEEASAVQAQPQSMGFGLSFDYAESYSESQTMNFQATGLVKTEDGRTIDFNVALNMSRSFQSNLEVHVRAGDAKVDPLVINLEGAPALSGKDFTFDLDNDGDTEQISKLMSGSGFLALDKNSDGEINNGGELFGPTLGDGFAELMAYDEDHNSWIDENDAIYDKLRIWMSDEEGNMRLFALGQKGVGAIYLGNVSSAFDIKDAQNGLLGTVQSTGVFLGEDGGAGTVQHIDLAL